MSQKPFVRGSGASCLRCMHAEHVGPEGVAYISGRRRGPMTCEAFESDLRRKSFEVVHGGEKRDYAEDLHAHDFDLRIIVLSGEITLTRDNKPAGGTAVFKLDLV